LLVSVSLLACFPHNHKARLYAELGEGAALVGGIAVAAVAGTSADCDEMAMPGIDVSACRNRATVLGGVGVALIVAGLLGFVATISTAEEDKPTVDVKAPPKAPEPVPAAAPPTDAGSAAPPAEGSGAGSAGSAAGSAAPPAAGSAATP